MNGVGSGARDAIDGPLRKRRRGRTRRRRIILQASELASDESISVFGWEEESRIGIWEFFWGKYGEFCWWRCGGGHLKNGGFWWGRSPEI